MRTYIFFFLFLASGYLSAQSLSPQVVNTCGLTYSNAQYSIDISVGESQISTLSTASNQLTQGFLQPNGFYPIAIETGIISENSIIVYPNPATAILYIEGNKNSFTRAWIINEMGQQISAELGNNSINVSHLAQGVYTLHLINTETNRQFFVKFIKL